MTRLDIIQYYIDKYKYRKYLEIGVSFGEVFFDVSCKNKIAVDPSFRFSWNYQIRKRLLTKKNLFNRFYEITSDDFFKNKANSIYKRAKLDICFVDGMHEFDFALNDILNSLEYLTEDGTIVVHDCNPKSVDAEVNFKSYKERGYTGTWNGDVWKCMVYLQTFHPELETFVVDTDHGVGIIRRSMNGKRNASFKFSDKDSIRNLGYSDLDMNRSQYLNLISLEDFKAIQAK